jgi:flagellar biogenesis protein FliO
MVHAMSPTASYLLQTFATLLVVCALAVAVLVGARRLGAGRTFGALRLVAHLPLEARRAVYLVGAGDKVWVIGASEAGLVKLGEMAAAELRVGESAPPQSSFAAVLGRLAGVREPRSPSPAPSLAPEVVEASAQPDAKDHQ